jgi:hypothetical protein
VIKKNSDIMAFVEELAHPSSLRRKRRGMYPKRIQRAGRSTGVVAGGLSGDHR